MYFMNVTTPLYMSVLGFLVSLMISYVITPKVMKFMLSHNIYGYDVHKPNKPKVPEACGISYVISSALTLLLLSALTSEEVKTKILVFIGVGVYIALIGLIDDLKPMNAIVKTLLTMIGVLPIILLHVYVPYPYLPFIGKTRITIIYLIVLPLAIGVTSNATNMMDTYNGALVSTSSIIYLTLLFSSAIGYLMGKVDCFALLASSVLLGALLGFLPYNWYPARAFNGDCGSLYVGATLGLIAVLGRLEIVVLTALMPYILNGFYILASIKGLKERREIKVRPVKVLKDVGMLDANRLKEAPLTLAHLLLLGGPLSEKDLVCSMIALQVVASTLAFLTALLILL